MPTQEAPASRPFRRGRLFYGGLLTALVLGHMAVNGYWLHRDLNLRSYDASPHLLAEAQAYRVVQRQGVAGALRVARGVGAGWWPSASYLPWTAMSLVFGHSMAKLRFYNIIFLTLMMVSTYFLGRRLHSRRAGLLAALLVGFFPAVYGESRQFGMDLPGAALVTMSMALLLATNRLSSPWRSLLLGLGAGVCLLFRPQWVLLLMPPVLAQLVLSLGAGRTASRARVLFNVWLSLAAALAVTSLWWLGRHDILFNFLIGQRRGAEFSGDSLPSWLFYLGALPWACSSFLILAFLGSLACWHRSPPWTGWMKRQAGIVLWAWLLGGLVGISLIKIHFLRFLLPICPAIALVTACGLLQAPRRIIRRSLVGLVVCMAASTWLVDSLVFTVTPRNTLPAGLLREEPRGMTNGPPEVSLLLTSMEAIARELQRRHPRGRGASVRMLCPAEEKLLITWMAAPVLRLRLPELVIQRLWFARRDLSAARLLIAGTAMPLLPEKMPIKQQYVISFNPSRPALRGSPPVSGGRLLLSMPAPHDGSGISVSLWHRGGRSNGFHATTVYHH